MVKLSFQVLTSLFGCLCSCCPAAGEEQNKGSISRYHLTREGSSHCLWEPLRCLTRAGALGQMPKQSKVNRRKHIPYRVWLPSQSVLELSNHHFVECVSVRQMWLLFGHGLRSLSSLLYVWHWPVLSNVGERVQGVESQPWISYF